MGAKGNNLCFDEQLFHKKDFSVDKFLTEHKQITNLETLRDDLGLFLKNLRSSTIELINKDYADFVDLSTNLIAVEQSICGIEAPAIKIKEEVENTKNLLDGSINKIEVLLDRRKQTRKNMQSLKSALKVRTSIEKLRNQITNINSDGTDQATQILKLDRALSEINQYYFHSKQCDGSLDEKYVQEFDKLFDTFLLHLKDLFLHSIKSEKKFLGNCLSLYLALDKVSLAHEIVKQEIVAPLLSKLITENALHNEPGGLERLYSKILTNIDHELRCLLDLTQTPANKDRLKGFDFMVHSVWPELESRLEFNLKSIYSPGNPETFFKCYNLTLSFLDRVEEHCASRQSVANLRNFKSYRNLLHCWNLPVYYTLRFQELGGQLEKVIHARKYVLAGNSNDWKLVVSEEAWSCLRRCWDEDIFIRQLAHRFWKFNLQIIARYQVWIENMLDMLPADKLPVSKINFLVYMYNDGCHLIEKFPIILDTALKSIGSSLPAVLAENMHECLKESEGNLRTVLKKVELNVIELISEKNVPVIRQVSDIPRLYRRTNRGVPTQPCSYVASLLAPIHEIEKMHSAYTSHWIPSMLSAITRTYHEQVSEVLTSVQRTEESLRKFKQIRDPSKSDSKNNTDDDKIRLQLQIDIQHYINTVKSLTESWDKINKLSELNDILQSLKRN